MMYLYLAIATLFFINTLLIYFLFRLRKQISGIKFGMGQVDSRLTKALATNPPTRPAPNEAVKVEEKEVPLSEQTPWQIPQDVKIEVEGGDAIAPYEYEVLNANS